MKNIKFRKAKNKDITKIIIMLLMMYKYHADNWPKVFKQPDTGRLPTRKKFKKFIQNKNKSIIVACKNGAIIGVIIIFVHKEKPPLVSRKYGYIDEIYVIKKQRRMGIATELINKARVFLGRRGVYEMELDVFGDNKGAIKVYNKLGFTNIWLRMTTYRYIK